jgi:SpoVK/Ycf46/Vps4 family AAA+-type ATPase
MKKEKRIKSATHQRSSDLEGWIWHAKPAATWKDLTYSRRTLTELKKICSEFTPGKGLTCLFAGDSGTGKSMAAETIAKELCLDLYRIDLSKVVSKYIGETEKNLRQVFDRAEQGGAILFFDEADALFGKRPDVKNGHDRYSKVEINDLLQRLEAYHSLAILSTNRKRAFDAASLRRFRYVIDFSGR